MSLVFYHCATRAKPALHIKFLKVSISKCHSQNLNTQSQDYESSVLPLCIVILPFCHFLSPSASGAIQTLKSQCNVSSFLPLHNQLTTLPFWPLSVYHFQWHVLNLQSQDYLSSFLPLCQKAPWAWHITFLPFGLSQCQLHDLNLQSQYYVSSTTLPLYHFTTLRLCHHGMTSLPHNLQNAEWNGWWRKLVIEELHPDRGPGELPVKLFAVMNFLKRRKRYILLGYLM